MKNAYLDAMKAARPAARVTRAPTPTEEELREVRRQLLRMIDKQREDQ